jgi:hypothetical protein
VLLKYDGFTTFRELASFSHVDVMYAGPCEHGYEPSGSIKCREFLD